MLFIWLIFIDLIEIFLNRRILISILFVFDYSRICDEVFFFEDRFYIILVLIAGYLQQLSCFFWMFSLFHNTRIWCMDHEILATYDILDCTFYRNHVSRYTCFSGSAAHLEGKQRSCRKYLSIGSSPISSLSSSFSGLTIFCLYFDILGRLMWNAFMLSFLSLIWFSKHSFKCSW